MPELAPPTYATNDHGCVIETTVWAPARLDDAGRCCGRKPVEYRRSPDHHFFCGRCDRDFSPSGEQRQNWAYRLDGDGNYVRERPLKIEEARAAGQDVSGYDHYPATGDAR